MSGNRFSRLILSTSFASLLALGPPIHAITISVLGTWSKTVGALDLTGGAGSDLTSAYESNRGRDG